MNFKSNLTVILTTLLLSPVLSAQSMRTVSGKVLDSGQEPLIGAAVMYDGGKSGVITDLDGNFSCEVPASSVTLEVSCLGYTSKKVDIPASKSSVTVYLSEDTFNLDGSVVVGYGSQKKLNMTGAISTVESKSLQDRGALDVSRMLMGSVPGLNITNPSGRPGQAATINIRGLVSINGSNPLVLVDGTEGDLQRVNPMDVESISVIKDASSAAIYGARASAGVILVTTKQGAESDGKAKVRYSGRFGFTTPTTRTDYETRGYYSVFINNYFFNTYSGKPYATYTEEDMAELWIRRNDIVEDPERPWVVIDNRLGRPTYNYYANTDWYHVVLNDIKPTMSHNLSFSGGTKRLKYWLSAAYNKEQGVMKKHPDVYQKFTVRSKIDFEVNKWMRISNNTSYFKSIYNYPGVGTINDTFSFLFIHALASYPEVNPDGTSIYKTQYNNNGIMDGMMVWLNNDKHINNDDKNNISTTSEITITPIKQLEIKANYTYQFNVNQSTKRSTNATYSTYPGVIETLTTSNFVNKLSEVTDSYMYQSANVFATYADSFAGAHNLKVTAGLNFESKRTKGVTAIGNNLLSDTLNDLELVGTNAEGERVTDVAGGQSEYATLGVFARLNYDYKEKYLLEVSGRYDGTSRFAENHRWGFFPSASVGWRISEEEFFRPMRDWWNFAKLRYSFGSLGNQQVGNYAYIQSINLNTETYLFGGANPTYAALEAPVASNLTWETSQQHNLGLDLGFFDNRLNFTGEAYIRDTKDMLTAGVALPSVYGASSPKMNSADLRTKGYELSLSWKDMFMLGHKPFEYSVQATFSDYISHITKYDNPERSFAKNYYVGMTYGEIWGYHIDGLFASDEEAAAYTVDQAIVNDIINRSSGEGELGLRAGDLRYADLNHSGKIDVGKNTVDDPGDRRIIGNSQPRYNYGLNLSARYAGFDLSVFFQGIGEIDWYPAADARNFWGVYARPYCTLIPKDFMSMCWSEENPNAYFPRPRGYVALNENRELGAVNDRYLQNVGYCRLKNLSFGYTLPPSLTRKASIDGIRFYFTGENLFYWSALKKVTGYIDPEMAQTNGTMRLYPWQKTFMFGIDITF